MRMTLTGACGLIALTVGALPARAQIVTGATPIHHGSLDMRPASGRFDPRTGIATLRVHHWRLKPAADSNGIFPDHEEVVVALGDDSFVLPAGSLRVAKGRGEIFLYRAPHDAGPRAIRSFRFARRADGAYLVSFVLSGVDLSRLVTQDPACLPMAVIVGDDDGFSGAYLTRPSFHSHHVSLPGGCDVGNDWPWLL